MDGLFDLSGRTALVTGGRRGIGLAIAAGLAQAGADIVVASANMESGDSEVEKRVRAVGRAFEAYKVDFGDRGAVADFAATILTRETPVDILVNNAGTIRRAPAVQHSDEDFDAVVSVNLAAPFVLSREIGRGMVERGHGKIINIASLLSFQGGINVPGYAAAKSGIAGLTKALANEWASSNVNVNAIVPGYIRTDNTDALQKDQARFISILERIPAGRWGFAEDLAGTAVFLASGASDYVHGALIPVDGGWLAR